MAGLAALPAPRPAVHRRPAECSPSSRSVQFRARRMELQVRGSTIPKPQRQQQSPLCHVRPPSSLSATFTDGSFGLVYSPPTTTPCCASLKATEKIPAADVPACTGVSATDHVRPRSVDRNTRAVAPPPVPIQTFDDPCT